MEFLTAEASQSTSAPPQQLQQQQMQQPQVPPAVAPERASMRSAFGVQARPHSSGAQVTSATAPALGDYTDFRIYLKDVYEFRRAKESSGLRPYSYSTFSAAADIKSPNYLKLIIEGRRNLSEDMIGKFAKALRLNRAESDEFRALVLYGQATDPLERNQYLKELADLRAQRAVASGQIAAESLERVPGWIGWVLYAMTDQANVNFDPQVLQTLFRAKANTDDIRRSLSKLIESGELGRGEDGQVGKARDLIESPQNLPVELIRKLQAELIYLGIESLFRDSPKDREFGALTLALTEDEFNQVRFELRQLRKRLQKDISVKRKSTKGERVYQMNVQLFPVTEKAEAQAAAPSADLSPASMAPEVQPVFPPTV